MVLSDEKPVVTEIFGTTGPVDDCSQGRGVGMFSSPGGAPLRPARVFARSSNEIRMCAIVCTDDDSGRTP